MPPGRRQRSAFSNVPWVPSASIVTSAPPPVSRLTSATTSTWVKSSATSAPMRRDIASRTGSLSTPMTSEAPISLAPAVAHRPIGPCAKTTTASPICTPPDSGAAEAGRGDVGEEHDLLVGHADPGSG